MLPGILQVTHSIECAHNIAVNVFKRVILLYLAKQPTPNAPSLSSNNEALCWPYGPVADANSSTIYHC